MHKSLLACVALLALACSTAHGQQPRREIKWNNPEGRKIPGVEHNSFRSRSMEVEVGYNVYLPPGYSQGDARYAVIYFLHGAGGNENSDAGGFAGLVSRQIESKKIPPVICVFPNGGMSGYQDRPADKIMGETLIVKELIPLIDKTYRTLEKREGRAIGGFSMGGGGAVRLALKHPDLFSAAGSWAGALQSRGGSVAEFEPEYLRKLDGKVKLLLVVGDQDTTYARHKPVIQNLEEAKYPFIYRVLEGVPHNLGMYYEKTGEVMVQFLAAQARDDDDISPPLGASANKPRTVSRESVEYLQKLRKNTPFGTEGFDLEALRAGMGTRREPTIKDVKLIRVKVEDMPCEWVLASGSDPDLRLLYLHGGGFVSGSGGFYLPLAAHISAAAKCAVLLPDYRLAPEHRFPAGLEDCVRAHEWMIGNGPSGPAPAQATFIAGDSAGGSLTLATLLALRDRKLRLPAGGIPLSPTTDLTLASESLKTVSDPIISSKTMPVFRDHYLGNEDPRNPLASPVFGNYRGIPPLLIQVGEHEMLRDDSIRVTKKARSDGIAVKLEVWPGMFHVFQSHNPLLPEGQEAVDHIADFMRSSLSRK